MTRHVVLLLGPSREAISGVTTHLNSLFASRLATRFDLLHFQVGSEGRREGIAGRLARFALSPLQLAAAIVRHGVGLDFIPVASATSRGVLVANLPGCNTQSVSEYVFAALLWLVPDPRIERKLESRKE